LSINDTGIFVNRSFGLLVKSGTVEFACLFCTPIYFPWFSPSRRNEPRSIKEREEPLFFIAFFATLGGKITWFSFLMDFEKTVIYSIFAVDKA